MIDLKEHVRDIPGFPKAGIIFKDITTLLRDAGAFAAAVGLAGLIGFVGLVVPHAMRSLFGADHRRLLPAAALCGGAFLALCDALARSALPAVGEIPVGVVTSLVGGPFFLLLLRRGRKGGWPA